MQALSWRTAAGSNRFVCSYTGSDQFGDGTQQKPFMTLTKSYTLYPTSSMVCRGIFSETLTGTHSTRIDGDYYGAAIFDGNGSNTLYAFFHSRMIFTNTSTPPSYAGLGGAANASLVGGAGFVAGLNGSPALVDKSSLYWGVIGGLLGTGGVVYSKVTPNLSYLVSLGSYAGTNQFVTVYGNTKANTIRSFTTSTPAGANFQFSLFSNTPVYLDQAGTIDRTMFCSDTTFWYHAQSSTEIVTSMGVHSRSSGTLTAVLAIGTTTTVNISAAVGVGVEDNIPTTGCIVKIDNEYIYCQRSSNTLINMVRGVSGTVAAAHASGANIYLVDALFTPTGVTDTDKMQSVVDKIAALNTTTKLTLTLCKYTSQTATQIFNNAELLDFSLKLSGDANNYPDISYYSSYYYYGAIKPALNVPIKYDSTGTAGSWDEHTASGLVSVDINNNIIVDDTGIGLYGEISSKVVTVNSQMINFDGFKSLMFPNFNQKNVYLGKEAMVLSAGTLKHYNAGDILPIGIYVVKMSTTGFLLYNSLQVADNDHIIVTTGGTTFSVFSGAGYVVAFDDPNIWNPIYVRQTNTLITLAQTDVLQTNGVYLNIFSKNVVYNGRTIIPGESFTAVAGVTTFTCSPADLTYKIAAIFDDSRVAAIEWVPALSYDSYYNLKNTDNPPKQIYTGGNMVQTYLSTGTTAGAATFVDVTDTTTFPATGTILIGGITLFKYTSKTATRFSGASQTLVLYAADTSVSYIGISSADSTVLASSGNARRYDTIL